MRRCGMLPGFSVVLSLLGGLHETARFHSFGAAVAWPLAAAAQQSTNSKRLAIFSPSNPIADLHA